MTNTAEFSASWPLVREKGERGGVVLKNTLAPCIKYYIEYILYVVSLSTTVVLSDSAVLVHSTPEMGRCM
jgi:hypothetical protein